MSIKDNRNNDVYDVLGMSEDFRRDLIDNCFYKIDVLEKTGAEEYGEKKSNVWDASKGIRSRKHKIGFRFFAKGAAAVFAVGCLVYLAALGVKYYNNVDDNEYVQSVPLKNGKETKTYVHRSGVKGQDLDHYDITDSNSFHNAFESTDNEWYVDSLPEENKKYYYEDNKLMEDYEERKFSYTNEDGVKKTFKIVGKNFVVISKKEASENAKNHLKELNYIYNSGSDDQNYKIDSGKLTSEQNEFADYEYVYYIQGDTLCRLKITDSVLIWKDNSAIFYGLKKVGNRVYSITSGMNSFFEHNFEDANVIKPSYIELTDENTGKFEDIEVYQKFFINSNGKISMYYINENCELIRLDDVHITNYAGDKIKGNEIYRVLQEGLSNYMGVPSISAYKKYICAGKINVICNEYVLSEKKILKQRYDENIYYADKK